MDQPYQKPHVGDMREGAKLAGAYCQPRAPTELADNRRGAREIGDLDPAIERMATPHRPYEHQSVHRDSLAGEACMGRNLVGERMRRVEDKIERAVAQISGQPSAAAETADPHIAGDGHRAVRR